MGLISKIEDKLSGSNASKSDQRNAYDSSSSEAPSSIRHPISSNQGTSPTVGSNTTTDRDGYGTQSSKYNTTTSSGHGRQPNSYQTETRTQPSGYDSGNMPSTTTNTTTSTNTDQRQYYDPYSRKGQQTAASAATRDYGMSPSTSSSTQPNPDADIARSQRGGVLNTANDDSRYPTHSSSHTTDPRYGTQQSSTVPATGNQDVSTMSGEPALRHHYGRDAGLTAGAGAAGVGAYEMGKGSSGSRYPEESGTSRYPQEGSTSGHPNYSHVQPTAGHVEAPGQTGYSSGSRGMDDSAGGAPSQAHKMASAYEAGYKDAVEHMRKEHESMMSKYQ